MGHGIAQVSAMSGYNIVLRDIEQQFLDKAMEKIRWSLEKLVSKEKISKQESEAANLVFSKNEVTGYQIASLGIISIIGSIPLYISAEKNYKKSVSISPSVQTYHFYNTKNTSLGLNITYSF